MLWGKTALQHLQTLGNAPALPWDAWAHPSIHPSTPVQPLTPAQGWICLSHPSTAFEKGVGEGKQLSSLILHLHV